MSPSSSRISQRAEAPVNVASVSSVSEVETERFSLGCAGTPRVGFSGRAPPDRADSSGDVGRADQR